MSTIESIAIKKQTVKQMINQRNQLVEEYWQLTSGVDSPSAEAETLLKKIDEDYPENKITQMLDEVRNEEIQEFGSSTITPDKPYRL